MRAADALDTTFPVALDGRAPEFEEMTETWPDRVTARRLREKVHRLDVARAAQPPVVHVTVPGVPGYFTGQVGGPVAYHVAPDPLA